MIAAQRLLKSEFARCLLTDGAAGATVSCAVFVSLGTAAANGVADGSAFAFAEVIGVFTGAAAVGVSRGDLEVGGDDFAALGGALAGSRAAGREIVGFVDAASAVGGAMAAAGGDATTCFFTFAGAEDVVTGCCCCWSFGGITVAVAFAVDIVGAGTVVACLPFCAARWRRC